MEQVTTDRRTRPGPSVVMAHAFVTGGLSSDSERDISVGGVSAVPPSVFDGVDYVALGHLHGAQAVTERVRYSGSPCAMSFGEHAHTKGSWLVEVDESGLVSSELVTAPVDRPLRVLRGDLDDLLVDPGLAGAERAYCQVTLTDPVRPLGAMDRLRQRFPHTLVLGFEPRGGAVSISSYAAALGRRSDDLDVCCDFLAHVRGGHPASAAERGLFAEAVEASRVERAARLDELGAMLPGLGDELFAPRAGVA
jgi:exonuclease SbcD